LPTVQIGISVPYPLNRRLEELVALANDQGAASSRRELLAALIQFAPDDPRRLARLVRDYRMVEVEHLGDAELGPNVIRFRPGRRRIAKD
jgi:hypothetical protein